MIYTSLRFYDFYFKKMRGMILELLVVGLKQKDFSLTKNNQVYLSENKVKDIDSGSFFAYKISSSDFFLALKTLSISGKYKDQRFVMISNHSPVREVEICKYGWEKVLHSQTHTHFVLMLNSFLADFICNCFINSESLLSMFLQLGEFSNNGNKLKFSIFKKIKDKWVPLEKSEIVNRWVNNNQNKSTSDLKKSIDLLKVSKNNENKSQGRKKHTVILQYSKIYEQAVQHNELKNFMFLNSCVDVEDNYKIKGVSRDKKRIKKRMEDSLFLSKNKMRRSSGWKEQKNRKKQWKTKDYKFDINQLHPNVFGLFHN